MTVDTLPDDVDFVFFVEALPEDGLHASRSPSRAWTPPSRR